ncbi:hypothetical protein PC128_g19255 [Phytophthora cactorum]|nr:hypothetical protein PC128_g19255 [Phytophthora cactorum]
METTPHPPGIHTLSDSVIRSVALRSSPSRHERLGGRGYDYSDRLQPNEYLRDCSFAVTEMERITSNDAGLNSLRQSSMVPSTQRPATRHSSAKRYKLSGRRSQKDKEGDTSMAKRRRAYDRMRQQKYHARQREYEEELENATRQVKEETAQLWRYRGKLTSQAPRSLTIWIVATKYLRIFGRGIITCDDITPNDLDFLHAAMAPDVIIDTASGAHTLMRNRILFTQWFPDVRIQLKQLKQITEHSLIAFTTTSFTISAAAMKGAFPHLFQANEGTRSARVAARLRDQHLVLQSSVCFGWDEESKQVIRIHHQVDLVSVLVHILGNLEDVVLVFIGVQISPECVVRDNPSSFTFSCDAE